MPEPNEGLGWKAALEPDLQNHEALTEIKEVKDLGRKYVELVGKSKNALYVPATDAKDEDRVAFRAKLNEVRGVPATVDKYDLPIDKNAEGYTPELEQSIRSLFHKAELDNAQAKALLEGFKEMGGTLAPAQSEKIKGQVIEAYVAEEKKRQEEEVGKAAEELKKKWGADYDKNVTVMRRAVDNIEKQVPGFKKFADESGLGNNPYMLEVFSFIGKVISEDVFIRGERRPEDDNKPKGEFNYPSMQQ